MSCARLRSSKTVTLADTAVAGSLVWSCISATRDVVGASASACWRVRYRRRRYVLLVMRFSNVDASPRFAGSRRRRRRALPAFVRGEWSTTGAAWRAQLGGPSHAGRLTNGSMNDKIASSSDPLKTLSTFKGPKGSSVVIEARIWSWFESPGSGSADAVLAIESRRSPDGSTRASSTPRVRCATERAEQDGGDNKFATCKKTCAPKAPSDHASGAHHQPRVSTRTTCSDAAATTSLHVRAPRPLAPRPPPTQPPAPAPRAPPRPRT